MPLAFLALVRSLRRVVETAPRVAVASHWHAMRGQAVPRASRFTLACPIPPRAGVLVVSGLPEPPLARRPRRPCADFPLRCRRDCGRANAVQEASRGRSAAERGGLRAGPDLRTLARRHTDSHVLFRAHTSNRSRQTANHSAPTQQVTRRRVPTSSRRGARSATPSRRAAATRSAPRCTACSAARLVPSRATPTRTPTSRRASSGTRTLWYVFF